MVIIIIGEEEEEEEGGRGGIVVVVVWLCLPWNVACVYSSTQGIYFYSTG